MGGETDYGWYEMNGPIRILLLGGSGLLGTELQKLRKFDWAPCRVEFDFTNHKSIDNFFVTVGHLGIKTLNEFPDLIVNCAAWTAVEAAETHKTECYETNVVGVRNLVATGIPILHISTAYVFDGAKGNYKETDPVNPLGYYALTKALGEEAVLAGSGKIIRTLFKPSPWKYPRAYTDQITTGMYVQEAAKKIDWCIENFESLPEILHVGGKRQSIFDLASETRGVAMMSRLEVSANLPADVSLDDSLYRSLI